MYLKLILIIILLFIIYYVYDVYHRASFIIESFEDKYSQNEEYKDAFDKEYVDFYDIIYKDNQHEGELLKYVDEQLKDYEEPSILVVGSGKGSFLNKVKKKYKQTHGFDRSENMLKKSQENYPYIKTIKGDITRKKLFDNNSYDLIIFDEDVINQNNKNKIEQIIKNVKPYLKKNGILLVPIYEENYLGPRARYYTTNYFDKEKNRHGFTYINNFSHNCYYVKNKEEKNGFNYQYFDKIVLKDGNARIKKTPLYIPEKEDFYELFLKNGFIVKKIYQLNDFSEIKYEVAIFKPGINKINVEKSDDKLNN